MTTCGAGTKAETGRRLVGYWTWTHTFDETVKLKYEREQGQFPEMFFSSVFESPKIHWNQTPHIWDSGKLIYYFAVITTFTVSNTNLDNKIFPREL